MTRTCPSCGADGARRSHRHVLERLLFCFMPFRCMACDHRFFSFVLPWSKS